MKYLGVDFGLKKIGFAVSEGELAAPLEVVQVKNTQVGLKKILEIVKKEQVDEIVIGLPDSGVRSTILKVADKIKKVLPVHLVEETLTTKLAKGEMIELGLGKKKRAEEDAYSAAIILQNYLDA